VVLPCWSFLTVAPERCDALHVATHEAFHVVVRQRDEDLDELGTHFVDDDLSASFAPIAAQWSPGTGLSERRSNSGNGADPDWLAELPQRLDAARELFRAAVVAGRQRDGEERMYLELRRLFTEVAHELAWMAAADLADAERAADQGGVSWERLVGPHYEQVRDLLAQVPSALNPVAKEDLTMRSSELIPILREWLSFLGVISGVDADGGLTMGLVRPDF
jgi:hypothetical protein